MAIVSKWTPFGVALDLTATGASVTRVTATKFTVKITASWETYYEGAQTNYGMTAASGGVTHTISAFNGTKRSSGSGSFTGTYSISGNGSATKTITVTFRNFNTDNGDSATKNVTFNVTVPAWTSYTITFNANGGSGAPGKQTKWKDQALTISSTKPTRTGYSFLGWSTSASATTVVVTAGGTMPANANGNYTLYAVWKANTYQVTFNANGGSGAPAAQTKTYGKTLTLSGTIPTRTNYTFLGWGTSASATSATYAPGGSYTSNAAITLYAVWQLAYTKPRINNFSVKRCDSEGNVSDEGTYALVQFAWATDRYPASVDIKWEPSMGSLGVGFTYDTATNGTISEIIGDGNLSIESTYTVVVTVSDSGGSYSRSLTLNGYLFPIDALYGGGNGVAFGKPAEVEGYADFAFKALFNNATTINGRDPNGNIKEAFSPQNQDGNTVVGFGNFYAKSGITSMGGHDLLFGVSNIPTPGWYQPYMRAGNSFTLSIRTAGYVTNSGKDISFWIPMSVPVIGNGTVTVTSGNGFTLRQGEKYTHGSSASVYTVPVSYEANATGFNGIHVKAVFSDTTNVTNNDTIGIYWNGTITFS